MAGYLSEYYFFTFETTRLQEDMRTVHFWYMGIHVLAGDWVGPTSCRNTSEDGVQSYQETKIYMVS
jgi:hypothetical protein